MSVIREPDEICPDVPCFLCGKPLQLPAIMWAGAATVAQPGALVFRHGEHTHIYATPLSEAQNVFFHPACAVSFCRRLLQDAERVAA